MECTKNHASIWTNTKVTNISKTPRNTYEISAIQREGHIYDYEYRSSACDFGVSTKCGFIMGYCSFLLPQIHAVKSHPLHHIYVSGKIKNQHRKVSGVLSQIISGDYNQIFSKVPILLVVLQLFGSV